MKRPFIASLVLCIISLTGCMSMLIGPTGYETKPVPGTKYEYRTYIQFNDDIERSSYIVRLDELTLEGGYWGAPWNVELEASIVTLETPVQGIGKMLALRIIYKGPRWRFMSGEVKFKTDSGLATLTDDNPSRDVIYGGEVMEQIGLYPINTDGFIESVVNSSQLTLQYYNDPITLEPEQFAQLKAFLSEYRDTTYEKLKEERRRRLGGA